MAADSMKPALPIAICAGFHGHSNHSYHTGGAQFTNADGSVRFVSQGISWNPDQNVNSPFEYLGARADGNVVSIEN